MNKPIQNFEREAKNRVLGPSGDEAHNTQDPQAQAAWMLALTGIGYWLVFWGMNGLDKFLNRTDLGLITWYGKDRTEQFTGYFNNLGIPVDGVAPLLAVTGLIELAVAAPFLLALICMARGTGPAWMPKALNWGFLASAAMFIGFSFFDVVAGDRAELREHGLYLILVLVSWALTIGGVRRPGA